MKGFRKFLSVAALSLAAVIGLFAGCSSGTSGDSGKTDARRTLNEYDFTKASFSATDQLGREITPMHRKKTDHERYVGVFYFLWLGTHLSSAGVYDVTKLQLSENGAYAAIHNKDQSGNAYGIGDIIPGTENAEMGYPDGMQSPNNYVHWTTEPLYGYYNTADEWVITRHMELLAMADVDFIFFDTTNEYTYAENVNPNFQLDSGDEKSVQLSRPTYTVLDTILKLSEQGWDVPKVVFYTNNKSGERVQQIYDQFYASGKYDSIWFAPNSKPMIVGTTEKNEGTDQTGANRVDISAELQQYFDVRESQWPSQASQSDGFPWMDWSDTPQRNFYFEENKMVNVNVAQHGTSPTAYSSYVINGGSGNMRSSKGFNEADYVIEEDWTAGRNIEDQWQSVYYYEDTGKTVEMVTVTGWNEWLAWKYNIAGDEIRYVDNFNAQFSRDMEMDKYYYKDNFYLQLVRNVRKYKYGDAKTEGYDWQTGTPASFADFDDAQTVYRDFTGDAIERDFYGFDIRKEAREQGLIGSWYSDFSNRNDISLVKVLHDGENVYFYIETLNDIQAYAGGENWMNILISTKASAASGNWEGYDYIINRSPSGGAASVEKSAGGWTWQSVGSASMQIEGNKMMITVPLSMLGLTAENFAFEFKVADNVTNYTDIMDYYVTGDSAPIGRLNYSYGY